MKNEMTQVTKRVNRLEEPSNTQVPCTHVTQNQYQQMVIGTRNVSTQANSDSALYFIETLLTSTNYVYFCLYTE